MILLALATAAAASSPAPPPAPNASQFWRAWGDGKAEVASYSLVQPRYGASRDGRAVLIFVTEDFSDSLRVKADPGKHPPADVYPVLKLNDIRSFQTGIYDYRVMTSTFARVAAGFPVAKVSLTSQEWCGQVYHQILTRGARLESESHSYFDGEADRKTTLDLPPNAIFEDQLPILVRGLLGDILAPGETRVAPFLRSLWSARGEHKELNWTSVRVSAAPGVDSVSLAGRRLRSRRTTFEIEGGPTLSFDVETEGAKRILRWSSSEGLRLDLVASERLPYWQLNAPGGEKYLAPLGMPPGAPTPRGRD